jgi:hypothetical protein
VATAVAEGSDRTFSIAAISSREYRFAARQDITGYVARQYRTQGQIDTSFGMSYGIRF